MQTQVDHIEIEVDNNDGLGAVKEWLARYKKSKLDKYKSLSKISREGYVISLVYSGSSRTYRFPLWEYYETDRWKQLSGEVLERDGYHCQICGKKGLLNGSIGLTIHHKTYDNFSKEKLSDLITFCETCHRIVHEHIMPGGKRRRRWS
jgi:hypothetical protein